MQYRSVRSWVVSIVGSVAALAASGCAADESELEVADTSSTDRVSVDAVGTEILGPPPGRGRPSAPASGLRITGIKAEGDGCPSGSWSVDITPDGQVFTLVFSEYEVRVDPGQVSSTAGCHIQVDVDAARDTSFAVASLFYAGTAYLDAPGMRAEQRAAYSFKGPVDVLETGRTTLEGPYDDEYVFQDDVEPRSRVVSKCGKKGKLHVRTELRIENDAARTGTGFLNTIAADGTLERPQSTLRMRLEPVPCR